MEKFMIQILLHCCYYRIIKKIKTLILTEMISNILCNQHGGEGTSHHKYIYIYIYIYKRECYDNLSFPRKCQFGMSNKQLVQLCLVVVYFYNSCYFFIEYLWLNNLSFVHWLHNITTNENIISIPLGYFIYVNRLF